MLVYLIDSAGKKWCDKHSSHFSIDYILRLEVVRQQALLTFQH